MNQTLDVNPETAVQRKAALLKLLQIEPDHLTALVQATGWGEDQTRMALLQLTADGLVKVRNRDGFRYFHTSTKALPGVVN